ncbi:MAG: succinate dehydrogenase [Nitrosopumilus sp.]|nr:succinate dehydrogenase [Nitrosopumilus sp.]
MRESHIRKIHYGTALGAIGLVALHISVRFSTGNFAASLSYEYVISNYQNFTYALLLEMILILVSVHGFNGLRGILLDYRGGYKYEKAVNWGCFISVLALVAYGTVTIVLANQIKLGF